MLGWELRKPPIAGLIASISILIVMVAYTFIVFPLDNLMGIIASLVLDIIVFVTTLLVASRDVQWLEIFAVPKFQKWIGILTIVLAIILVIGMVAVSEDVISQFDASWIFPFVIAWACIVILSYVESAQKKIDHKMD